MKHPLFSILSAFAGLALASVLTSCGGNEYADDQNVFQNPQPRKPAFGYQGQGTQYAADPNAAPAGDPAATDPAAAGTAATNPPAENGTAPAENGSPTPAENPNQPAVTPPVNNPTPVTPTSTGAKPSTNIPFGTPVIGKKGYLYSPYAPEKGMVDVQGLPSGTKVECPYTFKHFRVP